MKYEREGDTENSKKYGSDWDSTSDSLLYSGTTSLQVELPRSYWLLITVIFINLVLDSRLLFSIISSAIAVLRCKVLADHGCYRVFIYLKQIIIGSGKAAKLHERWSQFT